MSINFTWTYIGKRVKNLKSSGNRVNILNSIRYRVNIFLVYLELLDLFTNHDSKVEDSTALVIF